MTFDAIERMNVLLRLVVIVTGSLVGCAAETAESTDEQDVTSTLTASFKEQVVESSTDTCKNRVVYNEIVGGIPEAAQKRINEALKAELPTCGNPADKEDTFIEQRIGMNRMGILSVGQYWSRYIKDGQPVFKNTYFLFELKTGKALHTRDVFNRNGEDVLVDMCDRQSYGAPECSDVGDVVALSPDAFLSHVQLVDSALRRATSSSFKLFEPSMFKHPLVKNLITTINRED